HRYCRSALLQRVGGFVGHQTEIVGPLAAAEVDVILKGERARGETFSHRLRLGVLVNANRREVCAKTTGQRVSNRDRQSSAAGADGRVSFPGRVSASARAGCLI